MHLDLAGAGAGAGDRRQEQTGLEERVLAEFGELGDERGDHAAHEADEEAAEEHDEEVDDREARRRQVRAQRDAARRWARRTRRTAVRSLRRPRVQVAYARAVLLDAPAHVHHKLTRVQTPHNRLSQANNQCYSARNIYRTRNSYTRILYVHRFLNQLCVRYIGIDSLVITD